MSGPNFFGFARRFPMSIHIYPLKVSQLFFKNNIYLIIDEDSGEAIVVDPAWELDKIEEILNRTQSSLSTILLTHSHFDHINLVNPLVKKYNAQVIMSKVEADHYGFRCNNLHAIDSEVPFSLGQIQVTPLLTPGHSKGSACYFIEDVLFSGDTLFIEGCGICMGDGADPKAMFSSLNLLKEITAVNTKICPGHSFGKTPAKPFSYLLENNIYLQFEECDKFVSYRMRKGQKGWFNFT